ncbi:unnamed protein product [Parascedosporium putredinis]|uniref:Aldehyde dehydrogenase domain-containing protein n=1 Tax=Parascedosporium putredinis TaxID=1442378 RepID=A0A9P1H659_9PEZI|nr:unnamed protein product [Parascedosporium putredinis]CAI7997325.1 unnamed protein product [Parascedosporium putredinis]
MVAAPNTLNEAQQLFVSGEHRSSSDNSQFDVINPMTGEVVYACASATVQDASDAIDSAHVAYKSWSKTGPSVRRAIFLKAADILEGYARGDAPEILRAEVSATETWIRVNIFATAGVLRRRRAWSRTSRGDRSRGSAGYYGFDREEALGVVYAISPWNAPINLTARAIACPLICGNTVVLRPSERSPKSQSLVIKALTEAGLPAGCVNYLPCQPDRAAEISEFAVKHPKVRRINFTGSERVGTIIAGWAASCLKKCVFELGGKAPVIVREDANIQDAVESIVFGGFANNGQVCMSTERVIVHKSIMGQFKEELLARTKQLKCGNHLVDRDVSISGLYMPASAKRVIELVQSAVDGGATLLMGDLQIDGPNKTIVRPHILQGVMREMDLYHQESFGPVMILIEYETDEQSVELANDSDFSLCASIFSRDIMRAMEMAKEVRAGSCHINGPTIYIEPTLPNGGVGGSSGYGRFGGIAGIEEFSERKIISLAQSGMKFHF